jgi:hypothetical protein
MGCGRKRLAPDLSYYPGSCLEELKKDTTSSVKIVGVPTEIRTDHFPNTSQNRYLMSQMASVTFLFQNLYKFIFRMLAR